MMRRPVIRGACSIFAAPSPARCLPPAAPHAAVRRTQRYYLLCATPPPRVSRATPPRRRLARRHAPPRHASPPRRRHAFAAACAAAAAAPPPASGVVVTPDRRRRHAAPRLHADAGDACQRHTEVRRASPAEHRHQQMDDDIRGVASTTLKIKRQNERYASQLPEAARAMFIRSRQCAAAPLARRCGSVRARARREQKRGYATYTSCHEAGCRRR